MFIFLILIELIIVVIPVAVVVLIIQAIGKKSKEKKAFDNMMRNIYIYLILIITLIIIITCSISAFRVGLDILLPEERLYDNLYDYEQMNYNRNLVNFITTITSVIVTLPVFLHHNKLAREERNIKKSEN